jgi:hypothetical protein
MMANKYQPMYKPPRILFSIRLAHPSLRTVLFTKAKLSHVLTYHHTWSDGGDTELCVARPPKVCPLILLMLLFFIDQNCKFIKAMIDIYRIVDKINGYIPQNGAIHFM